MGMQDAPGMSPVGDSDVRPDPVPSAAVWLPVASWLIDVGVVAACLLATNAATALVVAAGAPAWMLFAGISLVLLLSVAALAGMRRSGRRSLGQRVAGLGVPAHEEGERLPTLAGHAARATVGAIVALTVIAVWCTDTQLGLTWRRHWIPSTANRPTTEVGDVVLVNRLHYWLQPVRDGDLVVFRAPRHVDPRSRRFLMRVVGVPGDTIRVAGGQLYRDGERVPERSTRDFVRDPAATYQPYEILDPPGYEWGPHTVPAGEVFVLGDNRNNSNDSSKWRRRTADGLQEPAPGLPIESIEGKLVWRLWPPDRVGLVR
jgi:signal peptidase I